MSAIAAVIILGAVTCVVAGIYLIATSRRTVGLGPRCGHCQYNLTGSTANRCPECGRLFIEVGVVMQASRTSRVRRWVGIGLVSAIVPLFCVGTGLVVAWRSAGAATRAQAIARNVAAQQKARQAQPQPAARNQPTTAPTSQPRQ